MEDKASQEEDTAVLILHPSEPHLSNDISPMKLLARKQIILSHQRKELSEE